MSIQEQMQLNLAYTRIQILQAQVNRLQAALDRAKAECEGYVLKEIEDILNAPQS